MPDYTPRLDLEKPLQAEFYDIDVHNANMDKIDSGVGGHFEAKITTEEGVHSFRYYNGNWQYKDAGGVWQSTPMAGHVHAMADITGLAAALAAKASSTHGHAMGDITGLNQALNGKVATSRTINGKALTANITLTAADVNAVPPTRTVNGKALSTDIALTAADVGAATLVGGKVDPSQLYATIVPVTASRALTLSDAGKYLEVNATGNVVITIPTNAQVAFPVGAEIEVVQEGTGEVSFVAAGSVTMNSFEDAYRLSGQYAAATLKKRSANDWRIVGMLK